MYFAQIHSIIYVKGGFRQAKKKTVRFVKRTALGKDIINSWAKIYGIDFSLSHVYILLYSSPVPALIYSSKIVFRQDLFWLY